MSKKKATVNSAQLPLPGFKICKKCQKVYPYSDLKPSKTCIGGVVALCKLCVKKINHKNYQNNREYRIRKAKEYREIHPDSGKEGRKRYRLAHKKDWSRNTIKSHRKHPQSFATTIRNYRSRKLKAIGKHSHIDVTRQYENQHGLCYWCSEPTNSYHVDHYIPLSRNGTNWPENIVISCPSCNCSKNDRIPFEEWTPPNPLNPIPLEKTERIYQPLRDQ